MSASQTFTVVVVDEERVQITNALVVVKQGQTTIVRTTTDIIGEVQLTLPHGSYTLEVSATHFQTASVNITVPVPKNILTIALKRATQTITFVLISSINNKPIPGEADAKVSVERANLADIRVGAPDQEGKVSFTLEHGRTYIVAVRWGKGKTIVEGLEVPHPTGIITYRLTPEFIFEVVDDTRSRRLYGATVIVENLNTGSRNVYTTPLYPGDVPIREPGRYRVTVKKDGWKTVVKEYEYRSTDLRGHIYDAFILSPIRLTVTVRDPEGKPISGATVKLMKGNSVVREAITP